MFIPLKHKNPQRQAEFEARYLKAMARRDGFIIDGSTARDKKSKAESGRGLQKWEKFQKAELSYTDSQGKRQTLPQDLGKGVSMKVLAFKVGNNANRRNGYDIPEKEHLTLRNIEALHTGRRLRA